MTKEEKSRILRELEKEDILIVPYKWGIIFNWEGWNPLGLLAFGV